MAVRRGEMGALRDVSMEVMEEGEGLRRGDGVGAGEPLTAGDAAAGDKMMRNSETKEEGGEASMAAGARKDSDNPSMMETDELEGARALGGDEESAAMSAGRETTAGAGGASGPMAPDHDALLDSLPPVFVPVSGAKSSQ